MPGASPTLPEVMAALRRERLVPVIRTASEAEARDRLAMCQEVGLRVIELTTTTPGWEKVLAEATAAASGTPTMIGLGTVSTIEQGVQAIACGAAFLVSPYLVPQLRAAVAGRVTLIEAGLTPTELAAAAESSALVKLFPASSVGVEHLRAVRQVLPGIEIMPTGGIGAEDAAGWIAAGAIAVGIGGGLFSLPSSRIAELKQQLRAG